MKRKISKKIVSFLTTIVVLVVSVPITANAVSGGHSQCIMSGSWWWNGQSDLKLYVSSSALITEFSQADYGCVNQWNYISNNVNVSVLFPAPQASLYDKSVVYGYTEYSSNLGGLTTYYDINGGKIAPGVVYRVSISLNFGSLLFSSSPTQSCKKTFLHEVGHALLLEHPAENTLYSDHIYSGPCGNNTYMHGIPKSVMNQGYPNSTYISPNVVTHDIHQIQQKWGY